MSAEHGKQKGVKTMNQTCKDCLFYQPINAGCGICCYDIMAHDQRSPADGLDDLVQAFDVSCFRFREAHRQKNCKTCRHYDGKLHENAGICRKPRPPHEVWNTTQLRVFDKDVCLEWERKVK